MNEALKQYQEAQQSLPDSQYAWPLYGSGLDNLGKESQPIRREIPKFGNDELLMRIDAVSLCYTDVKEIKFGQNHPRLKDRDLKNNPIVPGHELSMTVLAVGQKLEDEYKVGQRFTMQPDVWIDGKSIPFSFGMDGAYRQYVVVDQRILNGDAGNYLIPIPEDMTYAAAAITEPWACVEAAYRMQYRNTFEPGGRVLIIGGTDSRSGYNIDAKWLAESKPEEILTCEAPDDLQKTLEPLCQQLGIKYQNMTIKAVKEDEFLVNDLLLLDGRFDSLEWLVKRLAKEAVVALYANQSDLDDIDIDLGRLHYDDLQYVGSTDLALSNAYKQTQTRSEFKANGTAWILGAGGPMGRMHLQRAIESPQGSKLVIASEVNNIRLEALQDFFAPLAQKNNKKLIVINPVDKPDEYKQLMSEIQEMGGVDDLEVMITVPGVLEDACQYVAPGGTVNIFAGMKRGVTMKIDPWLIIGERQARFVGHSGSALDDQKAVVDRCLSGDLDTNLSVAAIGGFKQIPEGIKAMQESLYPGKIVIFPHVFDFPLTGLTELEKALPYVAEKLGENDTWTFDAEKAFLGSQLP